MAELDDVMDSHSGMITRKQAMAILDAGAQTQGQDSPRQPPRAYTAAELLRLIGPSVDQPVAQESRAKPTPSQMVDIEDTIYRVFNASGFTQANRKISRRLVVLGMEGAAISITLFDKLAELIDTNCFERGDTVLIKNAVMDATRGSLRGSSATRLIRLKPANTGITDFSAIAPGSSNIDVIGRAVEIYQIRYASKLSGNAQVPFSGCVLSDSSNAELHVSMWGSSALATASIKAGGVVKIEFCSSRLRNDRLDIAASDSSRVLVHGSLEQRLAKK